MRIYEDNFAYEVERVIDRSTQVATAWRYNVYRIRPTEQLLQRGEAATKEMAEVAGRQALAKVIQSERKAEHAAGKNAA